ncbi:MAG: bifunctional riboflavin kinase/FMN adenylyltransferase, partial [Rhodocyclaceae bacterium]|nr:bifunctional riboflavin kinase/FMN adenylyltransferase [Rhodocyclaceae bacterium]
MRAVRFVQVFHGLSRSVPGGCALTIGNFDGVHRGH